MKKTTAFMMISLLICFSSILFGADGVVKAPEGFTPLLNGQDLCGWMGMKSVSPYEMEKMTDEELLAKKRADWLETKDHWWMEDGVLVNDGQGAFLTTEKQYGDIELLLEYKTVPKADSGVYLRTTPQVQIWDYTEEGGKWASGADKGSGGLWNNAAGSPGKDPLVLADKPFGEWNSMRIIQVGERTTVYLNDKLVVDHARMQNFWNRDLPLLRTGHIQLQTHGGEISWRNIFVREIGWTEAREILAKKSDPDYKQIFNGKDFTGWKGPLDNYQIEDGTILCKPEHGGTIYYDQEFTDFKVRLEFLLSPGGNNGLAIRYPGEGDTAYVGMTELQVIDNSSELYIGKIDDRQFHGSVYGMIAAKKGYQYPVGVWNYQEVTVKGSTIKVELNGTVILDGDVKDITDFMHDRAHPGKDRTSGYFGFAGHNDPIRYRNVFIKSLAD
jgi:hypothetical protein